MVRVVAWLAVVVVLSLGLGACKSPEQAEKPKEQPKAAEKPKDDKAKSDAPEERLLAAMKDVADLLNENKSDPKAAIAAVRAYSDKRGEDLRQIVEDVRKKVDAMNPDAQNVFWEKNTDRDEYLLWDGAMRRFEDTYPELYAELEELTNTIQSAGADHLIEEKDPVEAKQALTDAELEHEALVALSLEGMGEGELVAKLDELKERLRKATAAYKSAASLTDEHSVAVRSLVRAAELNQVFGDRLRALPAPQAEAKASVEGFLSLVDGNQRQLLADAKKIAVEKNLDDDFAKKAKASP